MRKIVAITLLTLSLVADKIVVMEKGHTYPFAEKNFIYAINEYIKEHKAEIEQKLLEARKKQMKKVKNFKPKGVKPLTPATEHKVRYVDLTWTLPYDIKDANGNIIYPKGYTFNPAKYVKLPYGIVVINANRKEEIEWLKKSKYVNSIAWRIFITDGSWYKLAKELRQPIYYCLPQIEERFQLHHTPSIVTQVGDKIRVEEIVLKRKNHTKWLQN